MQTEDRNSLFTEAERSQHRLTEYPLILAAKNGNKIPLLNFWAKKREIFHLRAGQRGAA